MAISAKPPGDPSAPQDASGRSRNAGDALADECSALETEVEELKAKYEMYFLGVELREPTRLRHDVKKRVLKIKEAYTRNTGLRFRLQTLHARFLSYERLWLRSAREREEGTYRRDLFRAKRHARGKPAPGGAAQRPGRPGAAAPHESEDVDLSDFGDEAAPPAAAAPVAPPGSPPTSATAAAPQGSPPPAAPPAAAPPGALPGPLPVAALGSPRTPPPPTGAVATSRPAAPTPPPAGRPAPPPAQASPAAGGRFAEAQMRELFDAYVAAKKRCNEDTSKLTFDAVSRSVAKQIPEIMQQTKAKSVEFKVVIKDGKARLTAVPKS